MPPLKREKFDIPSTVARQKNRLTGRPWLAALLTVCVVLVALAGARSAAQRDDTPDTTSDRTPPSTQAAVPTQAALPTQAAVPASATESRSPAVTASTNTAADRTADEGPEGPATGGPLCEPDPNSMFQRLIDQWSTIGIADRLPRPPAQTTEEPFQIPVGGRTTRVTTSRQLQRALDDARPGDVIELEAGRTFAGNFILPKKAGDGWIYIVGSEWNKLPPVGLRIKPSASPALPKVVTPNEQSAFHTELGAHHYRLVGLEITNEPLRENQRVYTLVTLGYGKGIEEATSVEQLPHDIVFDRCYIHGTPDTNVRRGILMNGIRVAVQDCHLSDFHERGEDSQAIMCTNGAGPLRIINNYLEGSGENVMFGGGDPHIQGLVPSDVVIRFNRMSKPWRWRKGHPEQKGEPWSVKNLFELKTARRFWVDSNLLENNWLQSQQGTAVLFTVRNTTNAPWTTVEDVTFTNNLIQHASGGIGISATDDIHPSESAQRILIAGNAFLDINSTKYEGTGVLFNLTVSKSDNNCRDVTIVNNTALHGDEGVTTISFEGVGPFTENFLFANNIVSAGKYGIHGTGAGVGESALSSFISNGLVVNNIVVGPNAIAANFASRNQLRPGPYSQASFGVNMAAAAERPAPDRPIPKIGADITDLLHRMYWVAQGDRRPLDPALPTTQ